MMAENFPKQMKEQSQTEEILQMLQIRQKKKVPGTSRTFQEKKERKSDS